MPNKNVAILISTMNRPEFMIRTLKYYTKMRSPHPIYIADSSNPERAKILVALIDQIKNDLKITYVWYPPGIDCTDQLLTHVKEAYVCQSGDDDYLVPNALNKCAEFLENNPDYASAGGRAVSFRLTKSGEYGQLSRLADYPRHSIESATGSQRLIEFLKNPFSVTFAVNRIDHMLEPWKNKIRLSSTLNELIVWGNAIVAGKSKVLDCFSLVRQIHDQQNTLPSSFDWIVSNDFTGDYSLFQKCLSAALVAKDYISITEAERVAKESFWSYMQKTLSSDYKLHIATSYPSPQKSANLRLRLAASFPRLKRAYRSLVRPIIKKDLQMHYEVLQPNSKYYADFQPVMDSFTNEL